MEYHALGRTGFRVSSIGMGCVTFGREIDESASMQVLDRAWERGIRLFDTAAAYASGGSETVLGKWLHSRGHRHECVVATKVTGTLTRDRILRSAEESLQRLQVDCIDLFQLHVWDAKTPLEETLDALNELYQSGRVRAIGCSNWQAWQLAKALLISQQEGWVRLQSVQPPYNLVLRSIEAELLPLCRDQQIGVLSYSPLGAGFLSGKYRPQETVPTGTRFDVIPGHQPIYFTSQGYAVLRRLETVSKETGYAMTQLALAWVLSKRDITSVLIGARNIDQVDQAFAAEALAKRWVAGDLSELESKLFNELDSGLDLS